MVSFGSAAPAPFDGFRGESQFRTGSDGFSSGGAQTKEECEGANSDTCVCQWNHDCITGDCCCCPETIDIQPYEQPAVFQNWLDPKLPRADRLSIGKGWNSSPANRHSEGNTMIQSRFDVIAKLKRGQFLFEPSLPRKERGKCSLEWYERYGYNGKSPGPWHNLSWYTNDSPTVKPWEIYITKSDDPCPGEIVLPELPGRDPSFLASCSGAFTLDIFVRLGKAEGCNCSPAAIGRKLRLIFQCSKGRYVAEGSTATADPAIDVTGLTGLGLPK